jgi:hypothetical protein
MNLYIETENGATKNHPAFEDNLIEAFGSIPTHWEPFIRVECPVPTTYQILESNEPTYTKVDGVWTDVWALRDMTVEEVTIKQQTAKDAWAALPNRNNFTAWTFDNITCLMVPPIPYPEPIEGVTIAWCGADNNWKEIPARPEGDYKFDLLAWQWVAR